MFYDWIINVIIIVSLIRLNDFVQCLCHGSFQNLYVIIILLRLFFILLAFHFLCVSHNISCALFYKWSLNERLYNYIVQRFVLFFLNFCLHKN